MADDEAFERVVAMLRQDFAVSGEVTRESHLRVDLGLDSLALTDLAFLVKQDFGLGALAPESFRGITTVGALADLVRQHG